MLFDEFRSLAYEIYYGPGCISMKVDAETTNILQASLIYMCVSVFTYFYMQYVILATNTISKF